MKRTYDQELCPVARSLDVVGERWTLLVLRDIMNRRRKFKELLETCEGISPNLLADRLKRLEERGMIERRFYSDHPPRAEYRLTDKGKAFVPVIQELYKWGREWEPRDGVLEPTLEEIIANPELAPVYTQAKARETRKMPNKLPAS
jgi:DNA-binding HxlR family transcriptional regulator